jgi:hypothetical protein
MLNNKRGQSFSLGAIGALAIMLTVAIVTSGVGSKVLLSVDGTFTANSTAENITRQGNTGLQQIADFLPVIGLVVVAAVVLTLVRQFG